MVSGVVRDSQTREPLAGVNVSLLPFGIRPGDPLFPTLKLVADGPGLSFETTTDAAGRYRFSDLPPHRYCLAWRKSEYWRDAGDPCGLRMVRTIAGRDVRLDLTLDRAPTLRGRFVDDSTNAPITGLQLTAKQQTYSSGMRQWVTYFCVNPHKGPGEFEMTQPPRGEFYLEIIPTESEKIAVGAKPGVPQSPFYGRSYYPGVTDIATASPIVLAPGEDRFLEIRLAREQPQTVKIEINAPGAHPDAKVQLALERRSAGYFPPTVAKASVNLRDSAQLEGLSAADYTLVAWTNDGLGGRAGAVRQFSTANRDTNRLTLDLEPALTLRGIVRADQASQGVPDGEWYLSIGPDGRDNPEDNPAVKVKAGGAFEVSGLLPGRYHFYAPPHSGWIASGMTYGAVDAIHHMATLDNASSLAVTMSREFGTVTGSLSDGDGPMDNAMVVLTPEPMPIDAYVNSFPWTDPDENGRYEFKYVAPGRYRVILFYGSTLNSYLDLHALQEHTQGYRDVTVLAGKTTAGVDFAGRR